MRTLFDLPIGLTRRNRHRVVERSQSHERNLHYGTVLLTFSMLIAGENRGFTQGTFLGAPDGDPSHAVIVDNEGRLGVGVAAVRARVEVAVGLPTAIPSRNDVTSGIAVTDGGDVYARWGLINLFATGGGYPSYLQCGRFEADTYYDLLLNPLGGRVGIGTLSPQSELDVAGHVYLQGDLKLASGIGAAGAGRIQVISPGDVYGLTIDSNTRVWDFISITSSAKEYFAIQDHTVGVNRLMITEDGNVSIGDSFPQAKLDVAGTVRCHVLEVTGADLAEKFDVSGSPTSGALVCADPLHEGRLRVTDQPYDESLIGAISGAGGIRPGLVLHQDGVATGDHNVAMIGRAYVLADAAFGAIKPGMSLTTSSTPGHAMRVGDKARAIGAVLGTALSGLKEGRGLVLVAIQRR